MFQFIKNLFLKQEEQSKNDSDEQAIDLGKIELLVSTFENSKSDEIQNSIMIYEVNFEEDSLMSFNGQKIRIARTNPVFPDEMQSRIIKLFCKYFDELKYLEWHKDVLTEKQRVKITFKTDEVEIKHKIKKTNGKWGSNYGPDEINFRIHNTIEYKIESYKII